MRALPRAAGPCYVALATVLAIGVSCDGVILVAEAGRSLGADDVTDVLGTLVVATVTASPSVARTVDAGLLTARLGHLAELRPLRPAEPVQPTPDDPHSLAAIASDSSRTRFLVAIGPPT